MMRKRLEKFGEVEIVDEANMRRRSRKDGYVKTLQDEIAPSWTIRKVSVVLLSFKHWEQ